MVELIVDTDSIIEHGRADSTEVDYNDGWCRL